MISKTDYKRKTKEARITQTLESNLDMDTQQEKG